MAKKNKASQAVDVKLTFHPGDSTITVEGGWIVIRAAIRQELARIEVAGKEYELILRPAIFDHEPKVRPGIVSRLRDGVPPEGE